jgi:hypothetical protein
MRASAVEEIATSKPIAAASEKIFVMTSSSFVFLPSFAAPVARRNS